MGQVFLSWGRVGEGLYSLRLLKKEKKPPPPRRRWEVGVGRGTWHSGTSYRVSRDLPRPGIEAHSRTASRRRFTCGSLSGRGASLVARVMHSDNAPRFSLAPRSAQTSPADAQPRRPHDSLPQHRAAETAPKKPAPPRATSPPYNADATSARSRGPSALATPPRFDAPHNACWQTCDASHHAAIARASKARQPARHAKPHAQHPSQAPAAALSTHQGNPARRSCLRAAPPARDAARPAHSRSNPPRAAAAS